MKAKQIDIGGVYVAKVSGKLARLRIERDSPHGGWEATNLDTGRGVRVKSARRLRRELEVDHSDAPADGDAPQYDPDQCWVEGCPKPTMVTCLGKPMCQQHWDEHCEETNTDDAASDRVEINTPSIESETDMAKKTSKKATKKKATKAAKPTKAVKTAAQNATKPDGEKRVSALDAAAIVLKKAKAPMGTKQMIEAMAEQGLWQSPGGKTPHATLYAAILREIQTKGDDARFTKADRGQFSLAAKAGE